MSQQKTTRYDLVVKNKPGELAKLTKLLSDAGVCLRSLVVANIGDQASIQFEMPQEHELPERLWRSGVKAR